MTQHTRLLDRLVARLAKVAPAHHSELVRGMIAELDSVADRGERNRFALGAIAAIARLSLSGYTRAVVESPGRVFGVGTPANGVHSGGLLMPKLTTGQLLRRHVLPFALSCGLLTGLLLLNQAARQWPLLEGKGLSAGATAELLLMAVPFTLALTIPMSVFIAVSWVFTRLGAAGVLAAARREPSGVRRLIAPVLGAAAVVAALTLVLNAQVVPRANARFAQLIDSPHAQSDRTMTVGQLREAARSAQATPGSEATARAAAFEVEVQKKFALAASCVVLALAGAAFAFLLPNGGMWLVLGGSALVFVSYWLALVGGESLADAQVISPFLAMWMANIGLLGVALILVWRSGRSDPAHSAGLAISG